MNSSSKPDHAQFPILDEDLLLSLPKASKTTDMGRIYTSPNSEDWVTWNILRALQRTQGGDWWDGVVAAARADASSSERWETLEEEPKVDLWRTVSTPPEYERTSRARMQLSDNEEWRQRTENPRSVEGRTEVDLVFESDTYLVYVEAKLLSDISRGTTYDPDRNQIARNIDCLIEEAGDREPFFWMFVKDRLPTRMYESMIDLYRSNTAALHRLLPHRDPQLLDRIVQSIAIVTWEELVALISDDADDDGVLAEIRRRVTLDGDDIPTKRSPEMDRLTVILPQAAWNTIDSSLSSAELVEQAVETLDLDLLRRRTVGELVQGIDTLENADLSADVVPTGIRWRLLPLLPDTWEEISDVTIGEMVSWESIGVGKIRKLLIYGTTLVLESSKIHRAETPDPRTLAGIRQHVSLEEHANPTAPSSDTEQLRLILPHAAWNTIDPRLPTPALVEDAVGTLDLDTLRPKNIGQVVHGMETLGVREPKIELVPTAIRWRLFPLLPDSWSEISYITVGEMLSWDSIGTGKVQKLLVYVATLVLQQADVPLSAGSDGPRDEATDRRTLVALRRIAAWATAVGHTGLVDAIVEAAEGRSDAPLKALAVLDAIDLPDFAGSQLVEQWDPRSSAERLINSFDDREREILETRILALEPSQRVTLPDLADRFRVKPQRVFQIEAQIIERLNASLSEDSFRVVARTVNEIRSAVGEACPMSAAPDIVKPDDASLVDELLSWYAGPYSIDGDWLVKRGTTIVGLVGDAFDRVAEDGVAETPAVEDELIVAGVRPENVGRLLTDSQLLEARGEMMYLLPRETAGRATVHLKLSGHPMTVDELFALDRNVDNIHSFRNAIHAAPRIVRVGPGRVALAEWEHETFPGIVEAMLNEIDAARGSIAIDELGLDLADRFGISVNSVRGHASGHPVFLSENGRVSRRPADRPYEPNSNLQDTKDCFVINSAWALRIPVDHDLLRGSGRRIPESFALHLGIQPLSAGHLEGSIREVHTSWRQYPAIGSIRLNVLDLGLEEGDFVFLRRATGSRLEFIGLRSEDLSTASPEEQLHMLVGVVDNRDSRPWTYIVGEALGLGAATPPTATFLKARLTARKQEDVLSVISDMEEAPGA